MIELLTDNVEVGATVQVSAHIDGVPEDATSLAVALSATRGGTSAAVPVEQDGAGYDYVASWTPTEAGRWRLKFTVSGDVSGVAYGEVHVRPEPS